MLFFSEALLAFSFAMARGDSTGSDERDLPFLLFGLGFAAERVRRLFAFGGGFEFPVDLDERLGAMVRNLLQEKYDNRFCVCFFAPCDL